MAYFHLVCVSLAVTVLRCCVVYDVCGGNLACSCTVARHTRGRKFIPGRHRGLCLRAKTDGFPRSFQSINPDSVFSFTRLLLCRTGHHARYSGPCYVTCVLHGTVVPHDWKASGPKTEPRGSQSSRLGCMHGGATLPSNPPDPRTRRSCFPTSPRSKTWAFGCSGGRARWLYSSGDSESLPVF